MKGLGYLGLTQEQLDEIREVTQACGFSIVETVTVFKNLSTVAVDAGQATVDLTKALQLLGYSKYYIRWEGDPTWYLWGCSEPDMTTPRMRGAEFREEWVTYN